MTIPAANADLATWHDMRDFGFEMILQTRRMSNFWALPTTVEELTKTFAPPGSIEDDLRAGTSFGFPSITVTFNALEALAAVTDSRAEWVAPEALGAIETHRAGHGGYGSPTPRKDASGTNAVPRHTAMAIIAQLIFSESSGSSLTAHLTPSVEWLLASQIKGGGWPYDRADPKASLGFLSTASVISALCLYFRSGSPGRLVPGIKSAITRGFAALYESRKRGVWDGDGSPPSYQTRNAACALRLLLLGDQGHTLTSLISNGDSSLRDLVTDFSLNILDGGWPDRVDQRGVSALSTISALHLVLLAENPAGLAPEQLSSAEQTIIGAWKNGLLIEGMESWDWQCLALLAARKSDPMSPRLVTFLRTRCTRIRAQYKKGKLSRRDLSPYSDMKRRRILFVLTEGKTTELSPIPRNVTSFGRWMGGKLVERLAWWIIITGLGFIISYYYWGRLPSDYLGKILNDVAR